MIWFSTKTKRVKTDDKKRDRANRAASWLQGFRKKPAADEVDLNLARLKNYLQEFTLINERTPQEVGLWDDLMLAAAAFGIAEEVAEQLTVAYPEYQAESVYYHGSLFPFFAVQNYSSSAMTTAVSTGSGGARGLVVVASWRLWWWWLPLILHKVNCVYQFRDIEGVLNAFYSLYSCKS